MTGKQAEKILAAFRQGYVIKLQSVYYSGFASVWIDDDGQVMVSDNIYAPTPLVKFKDLEVSVCLPVSWIESDLPPLHRRYPR